MIICWGKSSISTICTLLLTWLICEIDFIFRHKDPLGHVDFYLNGGVDQGCSNSCSHQRAYTWLIELYEERKICQSTTRLGGEKLDHYSSSVGDIFGKSGLNDGSYLITEKDC